MNASTNSAEASFLEKRQARIESRNRSNANGPVDDNGSTAKDLFWKGVQLHIEDWNMVLDSLFNRYNKLDGSLLSEDEKRCFQTEITKLSTDLTILRRISLSTRSSYEDSNVTANNSYAMKYSSLTVPDDLSLHDIRLLHKDFTTCQGKLDTIRNRILPKGKFIFRRYREAMEKRNRQCCQQQPNSADTFPTHGSSLEYNSNNNINEEKQRSVIENHNHRGQNTGSFHGYKSMNISIDIQDNCLLSRMNSQPIECSNGNNPDASVEEGSTDQSISPVPTSFSFRNIEKCKIKICAQSSTLQCCKSLHLQSICDSIVEVECPVEGPIHVTDCRKTAITINRGHQLRIHDSCDVIISLKSTGISSGIILEGCKRLEFQIRSPPRENAEALKSMALQQELDIKDFEWLRNGVPSPNYTVVAVDNTTTHICTKSKATASVGNLCNRPSETSAQIDMERSCSVVPDVAMNSESTSVVELGSRQYEPSDDDEL